MEVNPLLENQKGATLQVKETHSRKPPARINRVGAFAQVGQADHLAVIMVLQKLDSVAGEVVTDRRWLTHDYPGFGYKGTPVDVKKISGELAIVSNGLKKVCIEVKNISICPVQQQKVV